MTAPTFAMIGAAGYIAPRHMRAIHEIGGSLVAAHDPSDSVGIIDSHFPDAHFFTEFERFDRHVDKLRRGGTPVDYVTICTPTYLHDAHVRFALRSDADAICEKPLVLNPWNIDSLSDLERRTNRKVSTILQLRLHPTIARLKDDMGAGREAVRDVELTYVTSRGRWYQTSWKGDIAKSGGLATNIGVHFFDMLVHVFGTARRSVVHLHGRERAAGYLELEKARVRWFLSVDPGDLPASRAGKRSYRSVTVDGRAFDFSEGFADLHTESYRQILAGKGYGLDAVRPAIEIISAIRNAPVEPDSSERHPFAERYL